MRFINSTALITIKGPRRTQADFLKEQPKRSSLRGFVFYLQEIRDEGRGRRGVGVMVAWDEGRGMRSRGGGEGGGVEVGEREEG